MSLLNFEPSGYSRSGSRKPLKSILGIGALVGTIALGSTLAASINLNGGGPVEFGQGIVQTTTCDDQITLTPYSTFNSSLNEFALTSLRLAGVDGTSQEDALDQGCAGVNFTIKAYTQSGELTATYQVSLDENGNFYALNSPIESEPNGFIFGESIGTTESSTILIFTNGLLKSNFVYRITIESVTTQMPITEVSLGYGHTCVILALGGVKCWGGNGYGQLGNGTYVDSSEPVGVNGLEVTNLKITAGGGHTCVLSETGGVKCWGDNEYGQLGDGTNTGSNIPVEVFDLSSGVSLISAGKHHTCARLTSGEAKCWGLNRFGQLGDGTNTNRNTPVEVNGFTSEVVSISSGDHYTCAIGEMGDAKCWGLNTWGQLGDGTVIDSSFPVEVFGLDSGVENIDAGGGHTCALLNSGGVKCWGSNGAGQLGDNSNNDSSVPVAVFGLSSGVESISVAYDSCALLDNGGVKCWGSNDSGQLGDNTRIDRPLPINTIGLSSGGNSIHAGYYHTCSTLTLGGMKCWGRNIFGELGDGTNIDRLKPNKVVGLS
jgi:alpha-tubulin suppressor-like RCC1 family protein